MIRFNKTTSLLICATVVGGMLPLTAAHASVVELETKDGLIYDAQAFANGMYIYDGQKTEDSEVGTYFSTPKGDILIDDATGVGEKYGMNYINFKDDDILFNMMTGQAEDDSEEDKITKLENKFKHKVLNKANRYSDVDNFYIKEKLAKNCYSKIWYEAEANDNDRTYNIYIDENGDYLDASEDLNIVYYDANGEKVKLDTYEDLLDYNDENGDVLSIPMSKSLMVDGSNIYRVFVLLDNNKVQKLMENTKVQEALKGIQNNEDAQLMLFVKYGAATVYAQKISMEQGEKEDGAYLPKTTETYEANDVLPVLIDFITGKEVSARILGKNIYVVEPDNDKNEISYEKYKMTTVKNKVNGQTVNIKAVEKDDDFDEINSEDMDDFSIDAHGNLWVLSKGKVEKYVDGELEPLYKVDGSMNKLSVFDDNSLIVWNTDDEIYSVLGTPVSTTDNGQNEKAIPSENNSTEVETAVQTGWIKNEDGSWSYKNLDGTSATGWINDNGNWYYLNNDGIMATGWIKDGDDWYYLNPSGEMKTGWYKDNNGKWYYLLESGKMAHDTVINGYTIDSSGVWM